MWYSINFYIEIRFKISKTLVAEVNRLCFYIDCTITIKSNTAVLCEPAFVRALNPKRIQLKEQSREV